MRLPRVLLLLPVIGLLALFGPTVGLSHAKPGGNKPANAKKVKAPKRKTPAVIGIADQKPDFLSDQAFLGLGVRHARIAVAWDALTSDWQVEQLEKWMSGARAAGISPLVTFDRSRLEGRTKYLPAPAQFQASFKAFRARYPWVRDYSVWNEANEPGQPTYKRPDVMARYFRAMKVSCPTCKVLAGDLLDNKSMVKWTRGYVKALKKNKQVPRYWGLHNYVTANRLQTKQVSELLAVTKGELWLTETGGLVARRNKSKIKLPQGKAHAAKVTRFILRDMVALSPRISRVYLYQWDSLSPQDSWDSGFLGPDRRARPSLNIIKQILKNPLPAIPSKTKRRR